jgi:hypothetical protein
MPAMDTQPSSAEDAQQSVTQQTDQPFEKRPPVPSRMRARVEELWKETNGVPDFDRAVSAFRECQKSLFPSWFDRTDPFRGLTPQEQQTRETNRKVRVNYCLKNVQQTVAMLVPDDHSFEFKPIPEVGTENEVDPTDQRFGDTLKMELTRHLEEIRWQDIIQGYAQDAVSFRIACMKVTYDASYLGSPVSTNQEDPDTQQNVQRLRVLVEDHARRVFTDQDARFEEMMELKDSLGVEGELETWAGISAESIPLDCIRWDSTVRDIDRIHRARWISHDVLMNGKELRAKFPYRDNGDGTWEGIHPDDIDSLTSGQRGASGVMGDKFWTSQTAPSEGSAAQSSGTSEAQNRRFLVREVWIRGDGCVLTLVESLEYPAAKWAPVRTPACWYPFRFFRFNRVQGTVYGISDVEMQRDIQNRVNSKKTDEEKARWLSLVRWAYSTELIDEQEAIKLKNMNPGELKGINTQGQTLKDVLMELRMEYDPESFNTTKDEQDMRQMASLPEQVQGVTGRATFATEVDAAMQGAAISSNARMASFRREMEATYTMMAELLVQELTPEQVKQDCGPNAFWPQIHSEADGKRLYAEITAQVDQELALQDQAAQFQSSLTGQPYQEPNPDEATSARQAAIEAKCMEVFGCPEPMTREVLFKRMRCKVTVAINAQADRAAQGQSLMQLFGAIQAGATAAQAAGMSFDPKPLLKMAGNPEWATMFINNPAQLGATFLQLAMQNPQQVPPDLAVQIVQLLLPAAQQAQMAAQQQAQSGQPVSLQNQGPNPAPAPQIQSPMASAQPAPAVSTGA